MADPDTMSARLVRNNPAIDSAKMAITKIADHFANGHGRSRNETLAQNVHARIFRWSGAVHGLALHLSISLQGIVREDGFFRAPPEFVGKESWVINGSPAITERVRARRAGLANRFKI